MRKSVRLSSLSYLPVAAVKLVKVHKSFPRSDPESIGIFLPRFGGFVRLVQIRIIRLRVQFFGQIVEVPPKRCHRCHSRTTKQSDQRRKGHSCRRRNGCCRRCQEYRRGNLHDSWNLLVVRRDGNKAS